MFKLGTVQTGLRCPDFPETVGSRPVAWRPLHFRDYWIFLGGDQNAIDTPDRRTDRRWLVNDFQDWTRTINELGSPTFVSFNSDQNLACAGWLGQWASRYPGRRKRDLQFEVRLDDEVQRHEIASALKNLII
ncbi:MAG: hypothetical protein ACR2F8_05030 [Caulobacteraceae bacterium]